ncbi:MAG: ADP-ribosylglycohydrolase family protein [Myxococcota bacterium]
MAKLAPDRLVQGFTPWGTGYASDDTEHTRMVLQCLIRDPEGGDGFEAAFRSELRWWFLQLPVGIGLGTARACLWNLLGFQRSGVASAGNGPAMRAPILGAWNQSDAWLDAVVPRMTRITHVDARAEEGARLVAGLAAVAVERAPTAADVRALARGAVAEAVEPVLVGLAEGRVPSELTPEPSGFVLHTVPAVVAVVLTHATDFEAAVETAVRLGGDTDTVAAIVGAIVGTRVGRAGLPEDWLAAYGDWPWTLSRLEDLAHERPVSAAPIGLFKVGLALPLAVFHLFRRYATVLRA